MKAFRAIALLSLSLPSLLPAAGVGKVLWDFHPRDSQDFQSAPAVARNGTIYVGNQNGNLYALTPSGKLKWKFAAVGGVHTAPTIASDGTVYIGSWDRGLIALTPGGIQKWEFAVGPVDHSGISLGHDGTVYFLRGWSSDTNGYPEQSVYAVHPDGTKKWTFPLRVGHFRKPVVTRNKVFVLHGEFHGIENPETELFALGLSGEMLWRKRGVLTDPAVGANGVLYAGTSGKHLAAITPEGQLLWEAGIPGGVASTPAIDTNGTLYVGTHDGYVCAITKHGVTMWTAETSGQVFYCLNGSAAEIARHYERMARRKRPEHPPIRLPVALNAKGEIIVAADPGIVAFSSDGKKLWETEISEAVGGAPAISEAGAIYVGTWRGTFLAIQGGSGLQKSPWPMFARDPAHTSLAD